VASNRDKWIMQNHSYDKYCIGTLVCIVSRDIKLNVTCITNTYMNVYVDVVRAYWGKDMCGADEMWRGRGVPPTLDIAVHT